MPRVHRILTLAILSSSACQRIDAPTAPPDAVADPQMAQFAVPGFELEHVVTAFGHTCGLTRTGKAYCWGANHFGQLGNGTFSSDPTTIPTPVAGNLTFIALAASTFTNCGIAKGGQAFCWGVGDEGALGSGSVGGMSAVPLPVSSAVQFTKIAGGKASFSPVMDAGYFCALDKSGQLYCWGRNLEGQFGNGTFDTAVAPTLIPGVTFETIDAFARHVCGLTKDGRAFCAGTNAIGQLGNGTTDDSPFFVPVVGGHTFEQIATGGAVTCGITTAGRALCWGGWPYVGTDAVTPGEPVLSPVAVASDESFAWIDAAEQDACGVTTRGVALCWGLNLNGQLGDGTNDPRTLPTAVVGGFTFRKISIDDTHSCGITRGLGTWCWGSNSTGELGDGTTMIHRTPAPVRSP